MADASPARPGLISRKFHLGDLLSVVTGQQLAVDLHGVHELIAYVTGQPVDPDRFVYAADTVKQHLLGQHCWLASVRVPRRFEDDDQVWRWLALAVADHGREHVVAPMPSDAYADRLAFAASHGGG